MTGSEVGHRPVVRFDGVSVRFGRNVVVDNVSVDIRAQSVHAVVGQNGAGKSTLMKALVGVNRLASGGIQVDGQQVSIASPDEARALGIEIVYQDQPLADQLTVLENMYLGREQTGRFGVLDLGQMRDRAKERLDAMGVDVSIDSLVSELTASERVQMSVAAAMLSNPRVLILDEPTAALSAPEAEAVLTVIRQATSRGVAVLYISHRLGEITSVADDISILRDGKLIYSGELAGMTTGEMISRMIGEEVRDLYPRVPHEIGEARLVINGLVAPPLLKGATLTAHKGEILGLAGLVGSGAKEILRAIYGVIPSAQEGGKAARISRSPYSAVRNGFGFLPEERRIEAVFGSLEVRKNITSAVLPQLSRAGVLSERKETGAVKGAIDALGVVPNDSEALMRLLSGGNQQKAIVGRWILADSDCLLIDEPTAGVDVAAKTRIYEELGKLAAAGKTVILASSDFEELLGICDRVLVVRDGAISNEVDPRACSVEELTALAAKAVDSADSSESGTVEALGLGKLGRLFERTRRLVIPLVMVAVLIALGLGAPNFVSVGSGLDILRQAGAPALLAAALAIALGVGAFDVSIGAVALASATVTATMISQTDSWVIGLLSGVAVGVVAGIINGVLASVLKVTGFVATLGMLFVLVGVTLGINKGLPIPIPPGNAILYLGQGFIGFIPIIVVVVLVALAVLELIWRRTRVGLRMRAHGDNALAATLRGVSSSRMQVVGLGLSGTVAGLAGVLIASYASGSTARDGSMDLLVTALAAAFLGSAMTRNLLFDPLTAGIGSLFVTAVGAGLIANRLSDQWLDGVQGVLLLVAVVLAVVRARRLGQVAIF